VWEPVDCEGILKAKGAGSVAFVAAVVFGGRADIPSIHAMGCHVGALVGCDMNNDDTCAGRSEGALVEVVDAIETGVGGKSWLVMGRRRRSSVM
jgi:hypothetical protein